MTILTEKLLSSLNKPTSDSDFDLWHLGGGAGGLQHFMDHLMDPLAGLIKSPGAPDVTPELKKTIAEAVLREAGAHSPEQLAREENEVLVGLIRLRAKAEVSAETHA